MMTSMPPLNPSALDRHHVKSSAAPEPVGTHASVVSWGAIFAGAAAAAALSLILLLLGTGLGLSAVSPWAQKGLSAGTFGVSTILWLTLTQLFASGLGGYLAGRLRTRWLATHPDEIYFRDTAHGFLAWAIASLATAALLTSAIGTIVGVGAQTGATAAGGAASAGATIGNSEWAQSNADNTRTGYAVESLFRASPGTAPGSQARTASGDPAGMTPQAQSQQLAEVTRIFMNTVRTGAVPAEDLRYAGQIVAQRTGLSQQDAENRVTETYGRLQARFDQARTAAQDAADKARKASAYAALWLFISLLAGAFTASLMAIYGGRQRDM